MALAWFVLGLLLGTLNGIFVVALLQMAAKRSSGPLDQEADFALCSASALLNKPVLEHGTSRSEESQSKSEAGTLYEQVA